MATKTRQHAGRGLSARFLGDLQDGLLSPLRERIVADRTLCLALRNDYINVYYRGGNLLRLEAKASGYAASFDPKYGKHTALSLRTAAIRDPADVAAWLAFFPSLKLAIDLFQPGEEREVQQLIVRDNNRGQVATATDYFISDIEYANRQGRFDLVGIHWPSTSTDRRRKTGHRLVLGEVKLGERALTGRAGLCAHVEHINAFLGSADNRARLEREMVCVFNQLRTLGVVDCGSELRGFSDARPMLLFVLVNHDPASRVLRGELAALPPSPHADIHVATSNLMGYGLFDQGIRPLDEALAVLESRI